MAIGTATALMGAAALGAGASVYGANKASNTQKDAAQSANDLIFPYVQGGYSAQNKLLQLLGLGGFDEDAYLAANPDVAEAVRAGLFPSGAAHYEQFGKNEQRTMGQQTDIMGALESLPGYQFTKTQGLKAVQNSASARGLGVSGAAQKGAAQFATGLADQTYGEQFNRLLGLTTLGQNAAVGAGSNIIGAGNAQGAAYSSMGNTTANVAGQTGGAMMGNKLLDMYARNSNPWLNPDTNTWM